MYVVTFPPLSVGKRQSADLDVSQTETSSKTKVFAALVVRSTFQWQFGTLQRKKI